MRFPTFYQDRQLYIQNNSDVQDIYKSIFKDKVVYRIYFSKSILSCRRDIHVASLEILKDSRRRRRYKQFIVFL